MEALGLGPDAVSVYQAMLDRPELGVEQLARTTGLADHVVREALDGLADLMLVRASREDPGRLRAVSLELGLANMVRRQEAELAARQAQVAATRAAVVRMVAEQAETIGAAAGHGERLVGLDSIQDRLELMGRQARQECLGVHPGAAQRPDDLAAAREADAEALARGVLFRTLYQDAARTDPATLAHARWLIENGGEVRTAPVLPQRLVLVDRSQALVPLDPGNSREGALYITERGIVTALHDLFEQAWATAIPLGAAREPDPGSGLTDGERELLRLLGSGMTDEAAGHRLGVSLRTVRRMMSSIMERLNASSRFEAGIKAAHRGWL